MRKHEFYPNHHDYYEYHGNTEIVKLTERNGRVIRQDWIIFDSVEEALEYFNTKCGESVSSYH